jgi:hypothetical protein
VVTLIARSYLTAATQMKVDAMLANDIDPLTAHYMVSAVS